MTPPREIPSADSDAWTLAEGSIDGRPSLLRFRPGLREFLGDPRFSRRLHLAWLYTDDGASGMPSSIESEAMENLENSIVHALETSRAGVLAFVFTHRGTREWHYYVADSVDLSALVNGALADTPDLPIELQVEDDPEWLEFSDVLSSVEE